jgi:3-hydroxyacyl-CoA dehydrogenase
MRRSAGAGIVRREVSDMEFVESCIYALVNEGAYVLADKIAQRASDVDLAYVNGYGFPSSRGGLMFYADTVGLGAVLDRIRFWERTTGERRKPSGLFVALAERGRRFNS